MRAKSAMARLLLHRAFKPAIFLLALLPLAGLIWGIATQSLGANPAERLIRETGEWSLRLLILTLAVTPLRHWTGQPALLRIRRMLGLFTALYAALHFTSYAGLDMAFDLAEIVKDIIKRPFILVGTAALVLMLPLAATSFNAAIRALGGRRWQALHRSVYAVALLALLHFFWMKAGKNDFGEWSVYALIVAVLLGWRAVRALRPAPSRPPPSGTRTQAATAPGQDPRPARS